MKIICTKIDKGWILPLLLNSDRCPVDLRCNGRTCEECLNEEIEWVIEPPREGLTVGCLIFQKAAVEIAKEHGLVEAANEIENLPSVPAVPLDKLCEWLSEHSVIIPCETCRNFSNDYCTAIGDVDKPCPNEAEDWRRVITNWMEGLDDHR